MSKRRRFDTFASNVKSLNRRAMAKSKSGYLPRWMDGAQSPHRVRFARLLRKPNPSSIRPEPCKATLFPCTICALWQGRGRPKSGARLPTLSTCWWCALRVGLDCWLQSASWAASASARGIMGGQLARFPPNSPPPRSERACARVAQRTGVDDIRTLSAILVQSEKLGTEMAQALRPPPTNSASNAACGPRRWRRSYP